MAALHGVRLPPVRDGARRETLVWVLQVPARGPLATILTAC